MDSQHIEGQIAAAVILIPSSSQSNPERSRENTIISGIESIVLRGHASNGGTIIKDKGPPANTYTNSQTTTDTLAQPFQSGHHNTCKMEGGGGREREREKPAELNWKVESNREDRRVYGDRVMVRERLRDRASEVS